MPIPGLPGIEPRGFVEDEPIGPIAEDEVIVKVCNPNPRNLVIKSIRQDPPELVYNVCGVIFKSCYPKFTSARELKQRAQESDGDKYCPSEIRYGKMLLGHKTTLEEAGVQPEEGVEEAILTYYSYKVEDRMRGSWKKESESKTESGAKLEVSEELEIQDGGKFVLTCEEKCIGSGEQWEVKFEAKGTWEETKKKFEFTYDINDLKISGAGAPSEWRGKSPGAVRTFKEEISLEQPLDTTTPAKLKRSWGPELKETRCSAEFDALVTWDGEDMCSLRVGALDYGKQLLKKLCEKRKIPEKDYQLSYNGKKLKEYSQPLKKFACYFFEEKQFPPTPPALVLSYAT